MCNEQEWNAVLDKYHRRKVHEVRVRCPHKGSGCDWVGEVNELKRHADSCAKRQWECEYCGLKCMYGEGEGKHWPTCRKFPVPCPNGCEVGSVERCKVEQHRSVCSLEPVACEMKDFGCSVVVPRKELASHMRESDIQHLTAMAVLNLCLSRQLQQDSTERDRKISRLRQDMTEQKQLQTEMRKEMAEQMQEIAGLKQQQVKGIAALKVGQEHEGSQVKDVIAALSQQVEREKGTMTDLQTKTRDEMKELQTEMKTKMDEQKQIQTEMKTIMDKQKREVVELKAQVQEVQHTTQHIEEHTAGSCSHRGGEFSVCKVFTITNYGEHSSSSTGAGVGKLFNSYYHGYKFKLNISFYETPHNKIGAFLHLLTGEFDDQLHWPVEVKVRLELLNQAGDHHHLQRTERFEWEEVNERDEHRIIDGSLRKYSDLERKGDGVQYMMNDNLKFRVHLTVLPH